MKNCPDCRSPILSLMFIDASLVAEPYCERCCRVVKENAKPAPQPPPRSRLGLRPRAAQTAQV